MGPGGPGGPGRPGRPSLPCRRKENRRLCRPVKAPRRPSECPPSTHLFPTFSFLSPFSLDTKSRERPTSVERPVFPTIPPPFLVTPGSPSLLAFLLPLNHQPCLGVLECQAFQVPQQGQAGQVGPSHQGPGQEAPEGQGLRALPSAHALQESRWGPGGGEGLNACGCKNVPSTRDTH